MGTQPRLNGSPISSCEPANCYITGKKWKQLGDIASQYANALENILDQVNNRTCSQSHWIIWFKIYRFDFPSRKIYDKKSPWEIEPAEFKVHYPQNAEITWLDLF